MQEYSIKRNNYFLTGKNRIVETDSVSASFGVFKTWNCGTEPRLEKRFKPYALDNYAAKFWRISVKTSKSASSLLKILK